MGSKVKSRSRLRSARMASTAWRDLACHAVLATVLAFACLRPLLATATDASDVRSVGMGPDTGGFSLSPVTINNNMFMKNGKEFHFIGKGKKKDLFFFFFFFFFLSLSISEKGKRTDT